MIGIYKLTSPTGKSYIGQSKNIKQRLNSYKNLKCKKQAALYNGLCKYGFKNFTVEILEECKEEELNNLEIKYIEDYSTLSPNGYNLKEGGKVQKFTDEAKKNCRLGQIRTHKEDLETYDEPLALFDLNFNLIKVYKNLEEAALDTKISPVNIYYDSFCISSKKKKIWILLNSKNIISNFYEVTCPLIEIYEYVYKDNLMKMINVTECQK